MSHGERVATNSAWLFASEGLRRVIAFAVIFLIGRSLDVDDFGRFRLAQSFFVIFLVIATFGMVPLIVKRIAGGEEDERRFLGDVFGLKIVMGLIVTGLAMLVARIAGYENASLTAIVIMALAILPENLTSMHMAYYDGRQAMQYNGALDLTRGLVLLVGIVGCMLLHGGLYGILGVYVAHYFVGAVVAHMLTRRRFTGFGVRFDWGRWKEILRQALPFVAIGVVWTVTFRIDMVMLSLLRNEESVGFYGAGYSIFEILLILPNVLSRALFPALAAAQKTGDTGELLAKSVRVFFLVALPVGVGIAMTAPDAVALVFGEKYRPGGAALSVLGGGLILWFLTMGLSWAMTAHNKLNHVLRANVIALFTNIIVNAILIPRYGFVGAAVATVISESAYLVTLIGPVHREILPVGPAWVHPGTLVSTLVMGVAICAVRAQSLPVVIIVGVAVYAFGVLLSGAAREPFITAMVRRLADRRRAAT